ncbi:MAG: hypothetical protein ACOYUK_02275 [Patescibacteria group bacterium]|jgi:hypothetical protein
MEIPQEYHIIRILVNTGILALPWLKLRSHHFQDHFWKSPENRAGWTAWLLILNLVLVWLPLPDINYQWPSVGGWWENFVSYYITDAVNRVVGYFFCYAGGGALLAIFGVGWAAGFHRNAVGFERTAAKLFIILVGIVAGGFITFFPWWFPGN